MDQIQLIENELDAVGVQRFATRQGVPTDHELPLWYRVQLLTRRPPTIQWVEVVGPPSNTVGGESARYLEGEVVSPRLPNPSHCYDCGGVVVPTCESCGSQWIDGPTAKALDATAKRL